MRRAPVGVMPINNDFGDLRKYLPKDSSNLLLRRPLSPPAHPFPLAAFSDKALLHGRPGGFRPGLPTLPRYGAEPSPSADRAHHGRGVCQPVGILRGRRGRGADEHQGVLESHSNASHRIASHLIASHRVACLGCIVPNDAPYPLTAMNSPHHDKKR